MALRAEVQRVPLSWAKEYVMRTGYSLDRDGHLDLGSCYQGLTCDMLRASRLSKEYYDDNLLDLVAWDGLPVTNMQYESTWLHLVSKHGKSRGQFNPLVNLDLNRVVRLPVLKATVEGKVRANVYLQRQRGREDKVQVVTSGIDQDYVVILGVTKKGYILRTAYPSDKKYSCKISERGELVDKIRP